MQEANVSISECNITKNQSEQTFPTGGSSRLQKIRRVSACTSLFQARVPKSKVTVRSSPQRFTHRSSIYGAHKPSATCQWQLTPISGR
eukprot:3763451-Ditylum_brightwellii.AAC.1